MNEKTIYTNCQNSECNTLLQRPNSIRKFCSTECKMKTRPARLADYRERNKEVISAKAKVYREQNKEYFKKKSKEWYEKNRERVLAKSKSDSLAEKIAFLRDELEKALAEQAEIESRLEESAQ